MSAVSSMVTPRSSARSMVADARSGSKPPYTGLNDMQPRPMAPASRPERPRAREGRDMVTPWCGLVRRGWDDGRSGAAGSAVDVDLEVDDPQRLFEVGEPGRHRLAVGEQQLEPRRFGRGA